MSGIEVCSYGSDRGEGIEAFLGVLQDIAEVKGIERIRLGSLEPSSLSVEFIEGLAKIKQMCPHFHLSLQSGSDTVLKRMKAFPSMKLTTDIICGFPEETEDEFDQTFEFVKSCGIDKVHVFPYSRREGTRAASMPQVPGTAKKERTERLRKLSDERELSYAVSFIGKKLEVLVENYNEYKDGSEVYGVGYSREYVYCFFRIEGERRPEIGSIVTVEPYETYSLALLCKLL